MKKPKGAYVIMTFQNEQHPHLSRRALQKQQNAENTELLRNITRARLELEAANQNFSDATDPLLVDLYAYQIKASQAKYAYLLKKARIKGLTQIEYIKKAF